MIGRSRDGKAGRERERERGGGEWDDAVRIGNVTTMTSLEEYAVPVSSIVSSSENPEEGERDMQEKTSVESKQKI